MKYTLTLFTLIFSISTFYSQCWQKIASKYDHVIAIHVDGTLWNWGGGDSRQRALKTPTLFDASTNWTDISTGSQHYAAIKSDGTLWTWGENGVGQLGDGTNIGRGLPAQVGTDTDWKQVSCGFGHTVAIKTNGTVWIWGANNNGQLGMGTSRASRNIPVQLGTDVDWVEVSAGKNNTVIRKSSNSMWFVGSCYGSEVSQLRQVGNTSDWKTMSAGPYTDYGIKQNGTLWKWNQSGGAGTGLAQVGTGIDWKKVDNCHTYSTEAHALLIKLNGTLWAIGANNLGQLGDGTLTARTLPVQISAATDWKEVTAGDHYSFGLKNDASFWAWGRNHLAQFGNGENRNMLKPVNITATWKTAVSSKSSYNGHTLAIQTNGTLWAWGQNNDGQLGNGSTYTHAVLPIQIGMDTDWSNLSTGFHFSVGIKTDGSLWTWGRNGRGQLGLGESVSNKSVPTRVGTATDWVMTVCGSEFVLALKTDGTLWSWGYNYDGQLGNGNTNTVFTPTQIGTDSDWTSIASGVQHSLAIKADSTLWSWGGNGYGELGRIGNAKLPVQVGTAKWKKIAAGGFHTLGIQADSTLWTWGRNVYAQLGNNTTSNRNVPTQIGTGSWLEVTGGYEHSLGIAADHSLWGWGRNEAGELADQDSYTEFLSKIYVPTKISPASNWKTIATGPVNSIGINANGNLYTFGDSYSADYQMNFPQLGYVYNTPVRLSSCSYCQVTHDFNRVICAGESVFFNGSNRSVSGNYKDTLLSVAGCDSIVTMHLTVNNLATGIDVQTACESFTWLNNQTYTADNNTATYTFPHGAVNGCDSIVTLNLTIKHGSTGIDVQSACESFTWMNNQTYTASNNTATYTILGGAANGCDSIVTLNLTIKHGSTGIDVQSACESFTWMNNQTYTASNNTATYTILGGAANGCDSIITLNLTIKHVATGIDVQSACESFAWIDGNTYESSNNTATYTFPGGAVNGCDSIVTLNLTIRHAATGVDVRSACESFAWIDGNTYESSNNTATYTFPGGAANGCDSIVTLNLTIHTIDNTVTANGITLIANQAGATYQWIDCDHGNAVIPGATGRIFTAVSNGNYAVIVQHGACRDTSNCYLVNTVGVNENQMGMAVKVYPNPSAGQFTIELESSAQVEIADALGRIVYRQKLGKGKSEIKLTGEAQGVYLIKINEDSGQSIRRLVVKRD